MVTITQSDGRDVTTDETTGVASQGKTKAEALATLDEELEPSDVPWLEHPGIWVTAAWS